MTSMRRTVILAVVLCLALLLTVPAIAGCGGDDQAEAPTPAPAPEGQPAVQPVPVSTTEPLVVDALGTFDSKDPFVAQQVANGTGGGGSGDGSSGGDTTGTTGTTVPSQASTALHYIKVLSIDVANGEPTVTFEVDEVIYEGRTVGSVTETGWGQVKVIEIDAESQVVVFLHGSESRSLGVAEMYFK